MGVISGRGFSLIASNAKIASQVKAQKEFPYVHLHVNLQYLFNDNVPLL